MVDWQANIRLEPEKGKGVYIAPSAAVVGKIEIGDFSSIWPNVSARGDVNWIKIGKRTNIQDNSVLHVTYDVHPLNIGDDVTIGHGCILLRPDCAEGRPRLRRRGNGAAVAPRCVNSPATKH